MRLSSWTLSSFPRRHLCRPRGQSPPSPPPPPPSDAVRKNCVRGNDVNDNRDKPSIVTVVMTGWLHKQTRWGVWVQWWFVLDSSGGGALLASSSSAAGVIIGVEAAVWTTTPEHNGHARWRFAVGGACHPLRMIPLVKRGGKKKTKEEKEGMSMGSGGSGAEFCLVRVVVAALPNGSADTTAVEEEKEAAILLASDANETGIGKACGFTVHFGGV